MYSVHLFSFEKDIGTVRTIRIYELRLIMLAIKTIYIYMFLFIYIYYKQNRKIQKRSGKKVHIEHFSSQFCIREHFETMIRKNRGKKVEGSVNSHMYHKLYRF